MPSTKIAGRLETFRPIHLIRLLQDARVTGRLEFVRTNQRVNLFIEAGHSVFCTSSGGRLQLGEILMRQADLRKEVLDLALALQADFPGKRIGRILIESGSLTEAQVRDAVVALQQQVLCEVLLWRDGTFQFLEGELAANEDVRIELDIDQLVTGLLVFAGESLKRLSDREAA